MEKLLSSKLKKQNDQPPKKKKSKSNNKSKKESPEIKEKLRSRRKSDDKEFILFQKQMINNKDFKEDSTALKLILLISKLNGAIPKTDFDIDDPYNETLYLTNKIFRILKTYKMFWQYFNYYKIEDKILIQKIIPMLCYEYFPPNSYIVEEGDPTSKVYFILKGKISFRKKRSWYEEEEYKGFSGDSFGERDIIFEKKTKYTALSIDNCYLISIDKDTFVKYIEKKMVEVDTNKKKNLLKVISKYITSTLVNLERFIESGIQTLFFKKGELIYKEGDDNISLYLIDNGEANLIKNISQGEYPFLSYKSRNYPIDYIKLKATKINYIQLIRQGTHEFTNKNKNEENKNKSSKKLDLLLNKSNYQVLSTLSRGSFAGLEITTGITKFKYSLISNSDFTTVFKLNLEYLKEHVKEFLLNLLPTFIELEKNIHNQINQLKYIDQSILPLGCQKFKKSRTSSDVIFSSIENDNIFINHIDKIENKFDTNEGGFIIMNESNMNLHKQRNIFRDQLKDNQLKDKKVDCFVRRYQKEKNEKLKYKGVRMIKSAVTRRRNESTSCDNSNNNFFYNSNFNKNFSKIDYFRRPESPQFKSNIINIKNYPNTSIKIYPRLNLRSDNKNNNDNSRLILTSDFLKVGRENSKKDSFTSKKKKKKN